MHGVTRWTWDNQIKALNDAGKRVLVYDKYGRGYSDRPKIIYNQELYHLDIVFASQLFFVKMVTVHGDESFRGKKDRWGSLEECGWGGKERVRREALGCDKDNVKCMVCWESLRSRGRTLT